MKNVFLGILLLSAMLFAACGNDNKSQDNGITVEDSLKAENQNLNAFLDIGWRKACLSAVTVCLYPTKNRLRRT